MLNQIEKQFEGFMQAVYGKQTISQAQEKDIEKKLLRWYVCMCGDATRIWW